MAIANATILDGATIGATGGTAKTLSLDAIKVANGIHATDFSVTDARLRPNLTAKGRPSVYNRVTDEWSMGKREAVFAFPKLLASGKIIFPNIRIVVEDHPEMSAAELLKMQVWASHLLFDADFTDYVQKGVVA